MLFFLSEGYTSISVREPLANILAQQPQVQSATRSAGHSRDVNDSHYATVSDDSGMKKMARKWQFQKISRYFVRERVSKIICLMHIMNK